MSNFKADTAHTQIGFAVKHMMVSTVRGKFQDFTAEVEIDEAHPTDARIDVVIQAASVTTGVEARDNHLRSADFFEVEKFPTITFKSTSIASEGGSEYAITGDLTIHGVTKPVTLRGTVDGPFKDPYGLQRAGVELSGELNRGEFGLQYNGALEAGGVVVSDRVRLLIDGEFTKVVEETAAPAAQA
ncbi:MAG: YceI family protein [Candidatus Dormibacteraceae bacterium]